MALFAGLIPRKDLTPMSHQWPLGWAETSPPTFTQRRFDLLAGPPSIIQTSVKIDTPIRIRLRSGMDLYDRQFIPLGLSGISGKGYPAPQKS
jgi:hypothetical protein